MRTRRSVKAAASVFLAAIILSLASLPALAGGGATAPSVKQILGRAAIASAVQRSAHIDGAVKLVESTHGTGFSESVTIGARYSGDLRIRPSEQLKLKGAVQIANQFRRYVLKSSPKATALKFGHRKWICSPTGTSSSSPVPTPVTPAQTKALRTIEKWLRTLAKKVKSANLGTVMVNNAPYWDLRISLHTRLNLAPLVALANSGYSPPTVGLKQQRVLENMFKTPHPWLNLKVDVLVSELNYTVGSIGLDGKLRTNHGLETLDWTTSLSQYGKKVDIRMPAACH